MKGLSVATFKNTTDYPVDIPALDLHVGPGATFEVPDELAAGLENNPHFGSSRVKHPDQTVDETAAAPLTGQFDQPVPGVPDQFTGV